MSEDATHATPPPLPVWVEIPLPSAEVTRAAHAAHRHVATGSLLVKLWFPHEHDAGGCWQWRLTHPPSGWKSFLPVAPGKGDADVLGRADALAREIAAGLKRLDA